MKTTPVAEKSNRGCFVDMSTADYFQNKLCLDKEINVIHSIDKVSSALFLR